MYYSTLTNCDRPLATASLLSALLIQPVIGRALALSNSLTYSATQVSRRFFLKTARLALQGCTLARCRHGKEAYSQPNQSGQRHPTTRDLHQATF